METYSEFIQNIINTRGQWNISDGEYFEAHHIIPRCVGGKGNIRKGRTLQKHENIIWLYPQEHYHAHKLLALENKDNKSLISAWEMMAYPKGKTHREYFISEEDYAILRKLWSKTMVENNNFLDCNGHPWNYGLTKADDDRIKSYAKKISVKKKGILLGPNSEETKQKKREAQNKRYQEHPESFVSHNKNKIAITNIDTNKILFIDANLEIPDGYIKGALKLSKPKDMTNYYTNESMQVHRKEISSGKNNPMYQNGYKIAGGNNGHAIYRYFYENKSYECRDDLIRDLKITFPDISESAIRKIMNNNYTKRISNKYQYVIDNLTWKLKDENKIN